MLRHHLPPSVCSRTFRFFHATCLSRSIPRAPLLGNSSLRAQHSRLPEINQFLESAKSAQTPRREYSSSFGSEYPGAQSSPRYSEKFSVDKSDTSGRQWKTERTQFEERDDKKGFLPKFRSPRRIRRPRADLGGHLYDNYKPKEPTRHKIEPQDTQPSFRVNTSFDILQAIQTAFPHVERPTSIQARLIPAIMQGSDVILMDETGSGKTFGSVLALLPEISQPHSGITTLYVVPHRDLAYQIESWCQKLVSTQSSPSMDLSTLVRVIARPNTTPENFADIRKNPPRILISTPGALIDAMQFGGLRLETTLRRIVIDEVDAVMKIPLRYHHVQLRNRHTPEVAQVIDKLLRLMWEGRRSKPQMIMMSATLKTHVRSWLFNQKGWMAERVVRLHGIQEKLEAGDFEPSERTAVAHSAVVVEADGRLRNLNDEQDRGSKSGERERGILSEDPGAILELLDQEDETSNAVRSGSDGSRQTTTRPTKGLILPPSVLEAVATSVALDVSHRALLVIPNGVSIDPVVETLRGFGVETRTLNLREEIEHVSTRPEDKPQGHNSYISPSFPQIASSDQHSSVEQNENAEEFVPNPTLLVATTTAVRGIDIPTLSHVYIVGGLESEEAYRHIAGRAGRFGMPGSVVSFVGADGAEHLLGGTGERRIQRTFGRIGVQNKPFPHI
ncbi:unnamed protein product [Rhizoctonia solani]|uniref:ATP-dependent RNA helicase n=1 Tax=Rhizoctonia solani TaxID=456999 RepID=A0A8H3CYC5_9AGAM|nr:unnamed protein product [Rhizoctonia solani]